MFIHMFYCCKNAFAIWNTVFHFLTDRKKVKFVAGDSAHA